MVDGDVRPRLNLMNARSLSQVICEALTSLASGEMSAAAILRVMGSSSEARPARGFGSRRRRRVEPGPKGDAKNTFDAHYAVQNDSELRRLACCLWLVGNLGHVTKNFMGIEADHFRQFQEFDNIDTAATGFYRRDDGLVSIERFGKVGLAHAGFSTFIDDELNEAHMPGRPKCFLHMRCRPLTKPTDQLNRNTDNQKIWLTLAR